MGLRSFMILQTALLAMGLVVIRYQRTVLHEIHSERAVAMAPASLAPEPLESPTTTVLRPADSSNPPRPSLVLLSLRAEVSGLRAELDGLNPLAQAARREEEDWNQVWDGPKPSELPGFNSFAELSPQGSATPEAAYQSFQYTFRNQPAEALTPTRMKEIFDLPDDFDAPDARYSIDLGAGMHGDSGYRVVQSKLIGPGRVVLTIEIENRNGTSFREERTLIESMGRWRVQMPGIQRLPDQTPEERPAGDEGQVRTRSKPVFLP